METFGCDCHGSGVGEKWLDPGYTLEAEVVGFPGERIEVKDESQKDELATDQAVGIPPWEQPRGRSGVEVHPTAFEKVIGCLGRRMCEPRGQERKRGGGAGAGVCPWESSTHSWDGEDHQGLLPGAGGWERP